MDQRILQAHDGLAPEFRRLQIAPDRMSRYIFRCIAAGEAQEFFIARQKLSPLLLEHGKETSTQQKPEGVGKVVKHHSGKIKVHL